jgi:hypothetical protein
MPRPIDGIASPRLWAEALAGGPFGVVGPDPVAVPEIRQYSGFPDEPHSITHDNEVGPDRRTVAVQTSRSEKPRLHDVDLAMFLIFSVRPPSRMPYPIVIDKTTVRVKTLGRSRAFKGLSIGEKFVVLADLGDVRVTVQCPEGHPGDGFALARLNDDELTRLIREQQTQEDEMRQRHGSLRSPQREKEVRQARKQGFLQARNVNHERGSHPRRGFLSD